jgi:hypothetical protein
MATYTELVDGNLDLAKQENSLNTHERFGQSTVTSYGKQTAGAVAGKPVNAASLDDTVPPPHPLYLGSVDVGTSTAAVIAAQKAVGRNKVFDGTAYVAGAEKTVLGFRQSSS